MVLKSLNLNQNQIFLKNLRNKNHLKETQFQVKILKNLNLLANQESLFQENKSLMKNKLINPKEVQYQKMA